MGRRKMKSWFDYRTWLPPTKEVIAKMHEGRDKKARAKQQHLTNCKVTALVSPTPSKLPEQIDNSIGQLHLA